ncbi:MAG: glycosyltransferase [Pirellulaceae bacterium]
MFCVTSLPVGGAEVLLSNLVRRLDRESFQPEICCLKEPGPLGHELSHELPVHDHLLRGKYDPLGVWRLQRLFRRRKVDAVITVGAGDKMFWGRLAARCAGVPVIASALHSTGWPDGVGRLNRVLTPITDAFIAVAHEHGRFLVEFEGFPLHKVHVIPNGVDVDRFRPQREDRAASRQAIGLNPESPAVGIVAALRPEKNHLLFLRAAAKVRETLPEARFIIIGDGPERVKIESALESAGLGESVHMLGARSDIPEILGALDVLALTSHNEANPVSILEAMSAGLPVVSTRVGSIPEVVADGDSGFLVEPGDADEMATRWVQLLANPTLRRRFGECGRDRVLAFGSLDSMVDGYERLIRDIYESKYPSQKFPIASQREQEEVELPTNEPVTS